MKKWRNIDKNPKPFEAGDLVIVGDTKIKEHPTSPHGAIVYLLNVRPTSCGTTTVMSADKTICILSNLLHDVELSSILQAVKMTGWFCSVLIGPDNNKTISLGFLPQIEVIVSDISVLWSRRNQKQKKTR